MRLHGLSSGRVARGWRPHVAAGRMQTPQIRRRRWAPLAGARTSRGRRRVPPPASPEPRGEPPALRQLAVDRSPPLPPAYSPARILFHWHTTRETRHKRRGHNCQLTSIHMTEFLRNSTQFARPYSRAARGHEEFAFRQRRERIFFNANLLESRRLWPAPRVSSVSDSKCFVTGSVGTSKREEKNVGSAVGALCVVA